MKRILVMMIPAVAVASVLGAFAGSRPYFSGCSGLAVGTLNLAAILWLIERLLSASSPTASRVALAVVSSLKFLLIAGVVYFLLVGSGLDPVWFAAGVAVSVAAPLLMVLASLIGAHEDAGPNHLKGVSVCRTE